MGHVSDDPLTNSTASPDHNGTLEKGTALTFGSWTCVADGSGGFTSHMDGQRLEESDFSNQQLPNNSAALAAVAQDLPEDSWEEENF